MTRLLLLLFSGVAVWAQEPALEGVLNGQRAVALATARGQCLDLPAAAAEDRLQGPHAGAIRSVRCRVVSFEDQAGYSVARYRWTLTFAGGSEELTEDERVLLEPSGTGQVRPVWHARFESDVHGVWRDAIPRAVRAKDGSVVLSVMWCVNGTGGCNQEFLHRLADGRWVPVEQQWLKQLPPGSEGRMWKGFNVDPTTWKGEAGFYRDRDANCCPSEMLSFDLELRGDILVLVRFAVRTEVSQ